MITKVVTVSIRVPVTVDETKFDETFLSEFRDQFYNIQNVNGHLEHLASLYARNIVHGYPTDEFIEGYGPADEMGISFGRCRVEAEVE